MPVLRIDLLRGKPAIHRAAIRDGVFRALNATYEVPQDDRFAIVTEHDREDFTFHRGYIDVARSDDLVLIELTVSRTRGVAQKKALYAAIVRELVEDPGLRPDDVMVVLTENAREDWSFGRGLAQYVA